jgi:hypothetical protein
MDLLETLRSTGAVPEFTDAPLPDETTIDRLDGPAFDPPL